MATIFAWSGALKKRGELDGLTKLSAFGEAIEKAVLDTLNAGIMTKDLTLLVEGEKPKAVNTAEFITAVRGKLESAV